MTATFLRSFEETLTEAALWTPDRPWGNEDRTANPHVRRPHFRPRVLADALQDVRRDDLSRLAEVQALLPTLTQDLTGAVAHVPSDDWGTFEEGLVPDLGRYVEGEPECWMRPLETAPRRIATVYVEQVVSGGFSPADMTARGALVLAFLLALERRGWGVSLTVLASGTDLERGKVCYATEVKRPDQPIDYGRLLYVLLDPSWNRSIQWAAHAHHGFFHGMGVPRGREHYDGLSLDDRAVVLTGVYWGDSLVDQLRAEFARLGVQ